jgi:hypothetical protein
VDGDIENCEQRCPRRETLGALASSTVNVRDLLDDIDGYLGQFRSALKRHVSLVDGWCSCGDRTPCADRRFLNYLQSLAREARV